MTEIPPDHPRYASLMARERLVEGLRKGWVAEAGLTAHGRGEAFDYLLGETTTPPAQEAIRAAAALLLKAERPAFSLNGNVVALARQEMADLLRVLNRERLKLGKLEAKAEVCLFHRTEARIDKLVLAMAEVEVPALGRNPDATIPGLNHARALCDSRGIEAADVILVPLEDGDRALALREMGKQVITIDLNSLSRTAKTAHITIVDELTRCVPKIKEEVKELAKEGDKTIEKVVDGWDNEKNLKAVIDFLTSRLKALSS